MIREVQCLIGRIIALNRFLSRSIKKSLPFFKALKQPKNFQWTSEFQATFDELKRYLKSPLLLISKPKLKEVLNLYLAVSHLVVGSVLIRKEGMLQKTVYYVSQIFQDIETKYAKLEKVVHALVISTRRLCPYFEAHCGSPYRLAN